MLDEDRFLDIVANTPLVSIDLVLRSPDRAVLMGVRKNQPAEGQWFVPGGRILKGETIEAAFSRITEAELGEAFHTTDARLLGAFTHIYDTNFARRPGISTHYIVLAFELQLEIDLSELPQDQHSAYRWLYENDAAENIHPNSQAYFAYLE